MGKTATELKSFSPNEVGAVQKLYKLDPPLGYTHYDESLSAEYVIVSAAITCNGPSAYIFPADEDGQVISWGELEGSYRGGLDHEEALVNAGYTTIVK